MANAMNTATRCRDICAEYDSSAPKRESRLLPSAIGAGNETERSSPHQAAEISVRLSSDSTR